MNQHPFLGRIIGAVAAWLATAIITLLARTVGVELTPEAAEKLTGVVQLLVENVQALIMLIFYAWFHKLANKRLNPSDVAVTNEQARFLH